MSSGASARSAEAPEHGGTPGAREQAAAALAHLAIGSDKRKAPNGFDASSDHEPRELDGDYCIWVILASVGEPAPGVLAAPEPQCSSTLVGLCGPQHIQIYS